MTHVQPGPDPIPAAIAHFGLQVTQIEAVPGSYSSTVRLMTLASGERLVLKIPYVRRKLYRELRALQALHADLPVPAVLDAWIPEEGGPGALLLSRLPGRAIVGLVTPDLARQMGHLLARLHEHRLDRFGDGLTPAEADHDDWWDMLRARFEQWIPLCRSVLDGTAITDHLLDRAVTRYHELSGALPKPDGPCWVHFDYRPGNILIDGPAPAAADPTGVSKSAQLRVTGLIDFESARGGSAELDFVKVSHRVWDIVPGTKDAFCEGYAGVRPVPAIDRTLPFYRLHNAVGGLAWCVRRSSPADPFFRENLEILRQLL